MKIHSLWSTNHTNGAWGSVNFGCSQSCHCPSLSDITLQIVLAVIAQSSIREQGETQDPRGSPRQNRDRSRRKIQSWECDEELQESKLDWTRVHGLGISSCPSSIFEHGFTETDNPEMVGLEDVRGGWHHPSPDLNHSQEWKRQRKIFFEEKNTLSLLTGRRKPNIPQVEFREDLSIDSVQIFDTGSWGRSSPWHLSDHLFPREKGQTNPIPIMVRNQHPETTDTVRGNTTAVDLRGEGEIGGWSLRSLPWQMKV